MVALTIGMPTYNDFDGVYFTLQALRLYQDLEDTELLVIDNYGCDHTQRFVEGWVKARYIRATEAVGTATAKNRVFAEARGEAVLCCDSHVLFAPGTIARLKAYYQAHPGCRDLLQGPIVYDDLQTFSTHFEPVWRGQMWGIWATDPRGADPEGEPFEIWGQGTGVFSCRKEAWPGFNPAIRGFFGEAGYIHEKVRQAGGRCLCLPWLRWGHRFGRPAGVPYAITVDDKLRNYVIGHLELGLDLKPVLEHFAEHLPAERVSAVTDEVLRDQPIMKTEKAKKGKKGKKHGKGGKGAKAEVVGEPLISMATSAGSLADNGEKVDLPPVEEKMEEHQQDSGDTQRAFTEIFDRKIWGAPSVSGPGSTREETALIRGELESLFRNLDIRVLSDAACGDASWVTLVTGGLEYYFGFDIVESLIVQNLRSHDKTNHFFRVADIAKDVLPKADAILCRDCLGLLPSQMGIAAIHNFKKSKSTFLIATTFPTVTDYREVTIGGWWPLNLTAAPYNLPAPMYYLKERCPNPEDPYNSKSLGVWRISDL